MYKGAYAYKETGENKNNGRLENKYCNERCF